MDRLGRDLSLEFGIEVLDRILAGNESNYEDEKYYGNDTISIDYKILNYGIFTLYLILIVEFVRHYIDHAAHGRPFYTTVMTMVYSELATLGIVEFGLFLWGKYGTIDKEVKTRFADVHFALFFTAIFNAFQYGLTSIVSTRFSNRMWVKTEQLELDHYVEIREEYERVNSLIAQRRTGIFRSNIVLFAVQPGLKRRHESLRVQVKFHELRLHFLECNNLPFSLRVSDYLKRSELSILIGLVHVSAATWVLLIGIMNFAYYTLGMIGYTTSEPEIIGTILIWLFFVVDFLFIALSMALRWKMHYIFQRVMKTEISETSDHEEGIKNQQQLFWFGSPHLVISMIQLMNFGYALSLSILIIYWEYIKESPDVARTLFPVMTVGCYLIFLYNLSALLPEYTLCTSLGYLTNEKELQETVAMHRLREAERQRRQKVIEKATITDASIFQPYQVDMPTKDSKTTGLVSEGSEFQSSSMNAAVGYFPEDAKDAPLHVSDLVKIETKELRDNLPKESRENLASREERMRQRRLNRKKAVSDGVATMRAWNQGNGGIPNETKEIVKPKRRTRIRKTTSQPGIIQGWQKLTSLEQHNMNSYSTDDVPRRKSSSDPRVIQAWKESLHLENERGNTERIFLSKPDGPAFVRKGDESNMVGDIDGMPKWKKERLNRLAARKRERKRTQSASAIIQSWQDYSVSGPGMETIQASSDENYNFSDLRGLSSDEGSDDNAFAKINKIYDKKKIDYLESSFKKKLFLHTLEEMEGPEHLCPPEVEMMGEKRSQKTILNLSEAVLVDEKKNCDADDDYGDETVDTDKSIGNLSDVDVIQGEKVGMPYSRRSIRTSKNDVTYRTALMCKVRGYFMGPMYPNLSHVLGTSIVFYLVGHRVEFMLTKAENNGGRSPFDEVVWFWMEAIWFFCFMTADLFIMALFPFWKSRNKIERQLVLATAIDIVIVGTVVGLFFLAEAKRCCPVEINKLEAGSSRELQRTIGEDYAFESECTCPRWGLRTYGGIGIIEPFTSLIVLRLFRFQFAQYFIRFCDNTSNVEIMKNPDRSQDLMKDKSDDNEKGHTPFHDVKSILKAGTALELWERAMAEFPEIVESYGQFSGELLQAMLGLEVPKASSVLPASEHIGTQDTIHGNGPHVTSCERLQTHIKLAQSRHAKLPPRSQALVIAGHLGKPVKPMSPEIYETERTIRSTTSEGKGVSISTTGLIEFEVDTDLMKKEQSKSYTFAAPFARLVRSMRRCDRRHLPLLKGWISVDVVMTQFEIVYFEAIDNHYSDLDEKTKLHSEACRLALQATKGGKGLRLCDVARGRKVVGHLDFADVTKIHVEKDDVPISDLSLVETAASLFHKEHDLDIEYWSNAHSESEPSKKYARIIRWTLFEEDRLKISTGSGTLFFRFYSDLAHSECQKIELSKNCHDIKRDIAFQWAETISRICGRDQLEQDLPHFGEQNETELRDYLEVIHFHEKEAENERRTNGRGVQNVGNVELLFLGTAGSNTSKRRGAHKRIKSMADLASVDVAGIPNDKLIPGSTTSVQEPAIPTLNGKHRSSKSMLDFRFITQSQHDKPTDGEVALDALDEHI